MAIDVGRLRAAICGFAYRMPEYVDRVIAENATGTDGQHAFTDFSDAFRLVLATAELRLSRDERGNLVAHDLLVADTVADKRQ